MDMEAFEKHREKIIIVVINLLYMVFGGSLLGCTIWHHQVMESWRVDVVSGLGICGATLILTAALGTLFLLFKLHKFIILYCGVMLVLLPSTGMMGGVCLSTDSSHIIHSLVNMWTEATPATKNFIQNTFNCCGFENPNFPSEDPLNLSHPSCSMLPCCRNHRSSPCCSGRAFVTGQPCPCLTCAGILENRVDRTLKATGFVALAASMTMLFGSTWLIIQLLQRHRESRLEDEEEEDNAPTAQYQRF